MFAAAEFKVPAVKSAMVSSDAIRMNLHVLQEIFLQTDSDCKVVLKITLDTANICYLELTHTFQNKYCLCFVLL
jgi:hypothetical protein